MPKQMIVLSDHDISKIINGEEVSVEIKGENYYIRQSYLKDIAVDALNRKNKVVNTSSFKMGC